MREQRDGTEYAGSIDDVLVNFFGFSKCQACWPDFFCFIAHVDASVRDTFVVLDTLLAASLVVAE